jgi:hypothetical protein
MTAAPIPPQPAPGQSGYHPPTHGNWAQWGTVIVALLALVLGGLNAYSIWSGRSAEREAKVSDEHTDNRIDTKLTPAVNDIKDYLDKKLKPVTDKLDELNTRVSKLEGRFDQLDNEQRKINARVDQQASLARLMDPARILATIRAYLEIADSSGRLSSASDVADYRNVLQALPASSRNYWTTAAAVINYQSKINQMSGEAPDPLKVSKQCGAFGPNSFNNLFRYSNFSNCFVYLDRNQFKQVTFVNSVIHYGGGTVILDGVAFINCRFVLDAAFPAQPQNPALLRTLLESDLTKVTIGGSGG